MAKKPTSFMPEVEIHHFEHMDDIVLAQNLDATEFRRLLRSYRLAANVANAAWSMISDFDDPAAINGEADLSMTRLRGTLADYAPEHFPRVAPATLGALQRMYDAAAARPGVPPDFLDWFFQAIMGLQEAAHEGG